MDRLLQLEAEISALMKRVNETHDHAELVRCQKELELLRRLLQGEVDRATQQLEDISREIEDADTDEIRALIAETNDPAVAEDLRGELRRRQATKAWLQ